MKPEKEVKSAVFDGSAMRVPEGSAEGENHAQLADRGVPNWARYVSFLFSISSAACFLAISILGIFFQAIVGVDSSTFATPLLLALAAVPLMGVLILDYGHARALAGFRAARERTEALAQAGVAVLVVIALSFVHPLLGVTAPISAAGLFGTLFVLKRFGASERLWEFRPSEATAILSGRDALGIELASTQTREHPLSDHVHRLFSWFSAVLGFAAGSWLTANEIMTLPAVAGIAFISFWCTDALGRQVRQMLRPDLADGHAKAKVEIYEDTTEQDQAAAALAGLSVQRLSIRNNEGDLLLSDVSLSVAPGDVIGVVGDAAAGKSLFLQALVNPFDFDGLSVFGRAMMNGVDLWSRSNRDDRLPLVHLPPTPHVLPASGIDNLTCFRGGELADRGLRCLESLVFSTEAVDRISAAADATCLSSSDQKALALSRAFLLSPPLYLLDRPEDFSSEKLLAALVDRIKMEAHAGRAFVIITDNRALLECCSKLLMLREGRVVDFAPAAEIRGRMSSGWLRFVTPRRLESEDTLATWIKSHFKRGGDEANRAKLCNIAAELLAFSCQDVRPMSLERVCFDFKHFEGHAILKLYDESPLVSTGQMQLAHREAEEAPDMSRLSPLAKVVHMSESVDQEISDNRRLITVKVATYDPRKLRKSESGAK